MRICLIKTLDAFVKSWSSIKLAVVVDDIQLQGLCKSAAATANLVAKATKSVTSALETECHMIVSLPKLQILGSNKSVVDNLKLRKRLRKSIVRQARNLGTDFTAGKAIRPNVRQARIKKMNKRIPFLRRLKAAGGPTERLVKTGLVPGLLYNVATTGACTTAIRRFRIMARSAIRTHCIGRSLHLDLQFMGKDLDPGEAAIARPIGFWARAMWDKWVPRHEMLGSLQAMYNRLKWTSNPWNELWGPASVVAASLIRLGWHPKSPVRWVTHLGDICIENVSPRGLEQLAKEAANIFLWKLAKKDHPELAKIEPLPLLAPVIKLLDKKAISSEWSTTDQGNLRCATVGGRWTAEKRYNNGMLDSPMCARCGNAIGNEHHELFVCDASATHRLQHCCEDSKAMFATARAHPEWPIWTRALSPDPSFKFPNPTFDMAIT